MNITIDREYDFIPEWRDNKKEDKPVTLHMKLLTVAERDRLMDFVAGSDGQLMQKFDRPGMFITATKSIDNLSMNMEAIKDARTVLNTPALYNLFLEVVSDIIARNRNEDLKN